MSRKRTNPPDAGLEIDGDPYEWPVNERDLPEMDQVFQKVMRTRPRIPLKPRPATPPPLEPVAVEWAVEGSKHDWSFTDPYRFCSPDERRQLKQLEVQHVPLDSVVAHLEPKLVGGGRHRYEEREFLNAMTDLDMVLHRRVQCAGGEGDAHFEMVFYHDFHSADVPYFLCTLFHGTTWRGYFFVPVKR